jgi:hypothetical protein
MCIAGQHEVSAGSASRSPLWGAALSSDGELRLGTEEVAAKGDPPGGEAGAAAGSGRFI